MASPPLPTLSSASSKRSLSSLLGPAKAPSSPGAPSSATHAPSPPSDDKSGKFKGFINRLRSNSNASSLDGNGKGGVKPSPPSSVNGNGNGNGNDHGHGKEQGSGDITAAPGGFYVGPSNLVPAIDPTEYDTLDALFDSPFQQAYARAVKAVDRLESVQLVLSGVIGLADLGAGWIPGVGKATSVVAQMLQRAQGIALGKVAALRLVSHLEYPIIKGPSRGSTDEWLTSG